MRKLFRTCQELYCIYSKARNAAFAQRWIRFGLVGFAATASYFALGLFFVDLLHFPLLFGNALAYLISFAVSYAGQSRWTFQANEADSRMLPRYAVAQAIGLALNSLFIGVLSFWRLPYPLSMLVASASVPVVVYFLCKYWVFRARDKDEQI